MKTLKILPLVLLTLLLVAGCGGDQKQKAEPEAEPGAAKVNPQEVPDEHVGMQPPTDINAQPVDELPQQLTPITPEYPDTAQKLGIEGTVVLNLLINAEGSVRLVEFQQHANEPFPMLDKAAVIAAKKSEWKPAIKDGKPVDAWVRVPVEFKLREEKDAAGN